MNGNEMLGSIHQHHAPVLAICSSPNGDRVFAAGVDSRVICVQRLQQDAQDVPEATRKDPSQWKWVYTSAHRPHSHDVQALAIVPAASVGLLDSTSDR